MINLFVGVKMEKCKFIAELCCNHNGDIDTCKRMIEYAKNAGAWAVKLQKRDNDLWLRHKPDVFGRAHSNPENSYGATYYEHRKYLEFDLEQHKNILAYCKMLNIKCGCSAFDVPSAEQLIKLGYDFIKIPSPSNNYYELIDFVCKNFYEEIHLSLGMTLPNEYKKIIRILKENKVLGRTVLFVATSGYPVPNESANILEVQKLNNRLGKKIKAVGYSGHHEGIAIDIAAYSLGAKYIERHITLDRNQKGTDHKVALLPNEMKQLINDLNAVADGMHLRRESVLEVEKNNRRKLKWNS